MSLKEEWANLRARAELMQQIAAFGKRQGWTQGRGSQPLQSDAAADQRSAARPVSLDALVNISTAPGCRVRVDLDAA